LRPFVEYYWIEDLSNARSRDLRAWRIVPDTCGHLLLHIYANRRDESHCGGLRVVGARSVFKDVDKSDRALTLGARLRPGALPGLTAVPAVELTDRSVPATDLIAGNGADVEARIARAAMVRPASAVGLLRRALIATFRNVPPGRDHRRVTAAVRHLERQRGRVTAKRLATSIGVSSRTLRNLMRAHVGIGTKRYARICRAYHVIRDARGGARPWVDVALDAGYTDQPHLIRDFDALLGETPRRFLARASV
jgi:AraC-like DNA-binding protein